MAIDIEISVPSPKAIRDEMKRIKEGTGDVISKAVKETTLRSPAKVTKAITPVYGIKSGDVTKAGKAAKGGAKTSGKIKIHGSKVDSWQLTYSGRLLTPTHFSMTPTKRPEDGKKYKVKAAIFKGKKKVLTGAGFLAPTSAASTKEIPFKRTTEKRYPIEAIRTVSIPQMIFNQDVAPVIADSVNELLEERIAHHMERLDK